VIGRTGLLATVSGLALAAPFWVSGPLPMVDLPQHLAMAAMLHHHDDPPWAFGRFYEVEWLKLTPYWTYYLALHALSYVVPLDVASRLYLSLYALAVPWTGLTICSAFGAPRWAGLLMGPLALGSYLYFGFVNYVTGVLLLLIVLAGFQRLLTARTPARALAVAALSAVLFLTHAQPFAFLLPSALLLAVASPSPAPTRHRLAALLVFAPATFGLFVPWVYREFVGPRTAEPKYNFGTLTELGASYLPVREALSGMPAAIAGAYQDGTDTLLLAAWAGVVAALCAAGWRRGGGGHSWRGQRLALLALLFYLVLPMSIRGQWNIAPRFAWLAALLVVTAIPDPGRSLARLGTAAAVALTAAAALNAVHHHRRFSRESDGFSGVVETIPYGQRVLSLIYDTRSQVFTQWPYMHFGQYVLAHRGGAAGWSLAKTPAQPVRQRRPEAVPTLDPYRPELFRAAEHGPHFDYFIARAGPPAEAIFAGATAPPVLVYAAGSWRVWRNPEPLPAR
jgi:hypothetical protein